MACGLLSFNFATASEAAVISSTVLQRHQTYADAFRQASPFRHAVIENFFDHAACKRMLQDFPAFEQRYALNEMGEVGGKAVRMNVRDISDAYRELDRYLQTREFLDFASSVTGIPDLLYDPDYVGGGTHENRDGQGLDQHVDFNFHPGTRWHRRLNLIVYLNPEWDESWGGNLQLQADPWNGDTRGPVIAPLFNRAVIFETTERSWHGFSSIRLPPARKDLSRKSFAIYLYTKERPPQETAASHATVYVPDGMPADLRAGMTLDDARLSDLRQRFEARAALRLPLQGYATQSGAPLEVEMWIPKQLGGEQVLEIDMAGRHWTHHAAAGAGSRMVVEAKLSSGVPVELKIRARRSFSPALLGDSGDDRELTWRFVHATLVH